MYINKEEYKTNNLKYLWKNLDESNLINELNIEHKIHLAYLSLLIDKTVFKVKNAKKPVGEQVLKKLAVYICSDIGLMQGAFDYIIKNKITSLYIYGAGEILSNISNELKKNNILVKGIIDQKEKEVNLLDNKYKTKKLTSTPLNKSNYILVTSIASVDEIDNRISKHGKSLGFNIKTVTWHKFFNINNTQYNYHESNY